jgi:uncharacterized membrane protein (UPF0182 family)
MKQKTKQNLVIAFTAVLSAFAFFGLVFVVREFFPRWWPWFHLLLFTAYVFVPAAIYFDIGLERPRSVIVYWGALALHIAIFAVLIGASVKIRRGYYLPIIIAEGFILVLLFHVLGGPGAQEDGEDAD